jgi:hypothetical protein
MDILEVSLHLTEICIKYDRTTPEKIAETIEIFKKFYYALKDLPKTEQIQKEQNNFLNTIEQDSEKEFWQEVAEVADNFREANFSDNKGEKIIEEKERREEKEKKSESDKTKTTETDNFSQETSDIIEFVRDNFDDKNPPSEKQLSFLARLLEEEKVKSDDFVYLINDLGINTFSKESISKIIDYFKNNKGKVVENIRKKMEEDIPF